MSKCKEILNLDISNDEKLERVKKLYEEACEWMNGQETVTAEKYTEMFSEVLETARHLHCVVNLGYDPVDRNPKED